MGMLHKTKLVKKHLSATADIDFIEISSLLTPAKTTTKSDLVNSPLHAFNYLIKLSKWFAYDLN